MGHDTTHSAPRVHPYNNEEFGRATAPAKDSPDLCPLVRLTYMDDGEFTTITARVIRMTTTKMEVQLSDGPDDFEKKKTIFGRDGIPLHGFTLVDVKGDVRSSSVVQQMMEFMKKSEERSEYERVSSSRNTEETNRMLAEATKTNAVLAAVATESAQRFEVSVSTHKVDLKISRLPYDVRKKFLELHLPPIGSTTGGKSLTWNTTEFIGLYDYVIEEAVKLLAIKDEEITKRDAVCKKVQYIIPARPWTLLWIVTGTLSVECAFFLAVEIVMVDRQLTHLFRDKMMIAATSVVNATVASEDWAFKKQVKSCKEVTSGLFFSFWGDVAVKPRPFSDERVFHKKHQKWFNGGTAVCKAPVLPPVPRGAASQKPTKKDRVGPTGVAKVAGSVPTGASVTVGARPGGGVTQSKVVLNSFSRAPERPFLPRPPLSATRPIPQTQKGGGGPPPAFHKDLRPGEEIHDWIIALVGTAIGEVFGNETSLLFPDHIRHFLDKGEAARQWADGLIVGEYLVLAPLLIKGNHWVLMEVAPNSIRIKDSLRRYTDGEALAFARQLKAAVHGLRGAVIEEDKEWPQQAFGSNDCALYVLRAILQRASGFPVAELLKYFSRASLDALLPRYRGTATSSKDQGAVSDVEVRAFTDRLRVHFGRAPILAPSPVPPIVTTPALHACAWAKCGANVSIGAGVLCAGCQGRFCVKHCSGVRKGWRCDSCAPPEIWVTPPKPPVAPHSMVPCSYAKCKQGKGLVSSRSAWHCSCCARPFHGCHFNAKKGSIVICGECRAGGKRNTDLTDFSMANHPSLKDPPPGQHVTAPSSGFQTGQGSPLLAGQTGSFLEDLKGAISKIVHPLAEKGICPQTRAEHVRLLKMLAAAPPEMHHWPLARIALEVLELGRKENTWCWGTVENKSGLLAAALHRLDQYTAGRMRPLLLKHNQEWADAGRHIRRLAHQSMMTGLPAVLEADILKAIATAMNPDVKALLILAWATVGRCGDVSQLKTAGLEIGQPKGTKRKPGLTEMTVFFERGKVIGKIDPYHIQTVIPEEWAAFLRTWLASKSSKFLFQQPSKAMREKFLAEVRIHLRTVNPKYDLRAVRRGAAQTLAEKNVPLADIMYFTKHADVGMLRRYLRFGKAKSTEGRKGIAAGSKLWSRSC